MSLMSFAHPSWPQDKCFTRKFLSICFSYHKAGTPAKIQRLTKTKMRDIKRKTVWKGLERYPEIIITVLFDIGYKAPANLIPASLQAHHLPVSSTAPTLWPPSHALQPQPAIHHCKDTPWFCTFRSSTLFGKCLFICHGLVQTTFPSTLFEPQIIFCPASKL